MNAALRMVSAGLAAIWLALAPPSTRAEPDERYAVLMGQVSVDRLSHDEKRLLQLSLAFENHYVGLLDGDWGARSQAALEKYARVEFGAEPVNLHLAGLVFGVGERISDSGWDILHLENYGVSLLFPFDAYTLDDPGETFVNWHHTKSSLAMSVARTGLAEAVSFHDFFLGRSTTSDPYTVRRERTLITSVRTGDGSLYARSDLVGQGWTTIVLAADDRDRGLLNAVSASMTKGNAAPFRMPDGGFLDHIVTLFLEVAQEDTAPSGPGSGKQVAAAPPEPPATLSSGTGFIVTAAGHVLTNAHVVEGCREITAAGHEAALAATSEIFDLAVLDVEMLRGRSHAIFAAAPAGLNSDVLAAGFPLSDVLDGLNVTRGVVSSLKGLRGDSFNMQISAAVQAGNSGGPLLDSSGQVVGVVVAKLRQDVIQDSTGSVPENVNFAVRGEIAKLFLAQNSVPIEIGAETLALSPARLGEIATDITVPVECH